MGGDCSQKLLLRRGWHSSPGRSRSSDQYAIHNSIAKMGSLRTRLSGVRFSPPAAARLSAFPEISFPEPVLFPTAGRSVSSLFETSSTAAGVRSPPPNIGGVVPAGPPKWLPSPPPLTRCMGCQDPRRNKHCIRRASAPTVDSRLPYARGSAVIAAHERFEWRLP